MRSVLGALVLGVWLGAAGAAHAEPSVQLSEVRSALTEGQHVGTLRSGADCAYTHVRPP